MSCKSASISHYFLFSHYTGRVFMKGILQSCNWLQGGSHIDNYNSRRLKLPNFPDNRHMKVAKVISPMHQPLLSPRKYSLYSFLLEAESIPDHTAAGRIKSMKNPNDHIETQTHDLPACRTVPQPTAPPHIPILVFKTKSGRSL